MDDIRMDTPDMDRATEAPHACEGCGEPMLADEEDQAYCPDCRAELDAVADDDYGDLDARLDRALVDP